MRTERSTRVTALSLNEGNDVFEARMPAGHNRWFVIAAAVFGLPWLVGYLALSIVILTGASDGWRGFLAWVLLTLLTILIDVVAVAAIWAAGYALRGHETLVADRAQVTVRRRALGVTIPFARNGVRWIAWRRSRRRCRDRRRRVRNSSSAGRAPASDLERDSPRTRRRCSRTRSRDSSRAREVPR